MKFSGHSNGIALSLGVLAVVIAGSGTAVAVSATTTISDPDVPARIAHVDSAGRLLVAPTLPTSTIAVTGAFYNAGSVPITSPTKATLAITSLLVAETRLNGSTNGSDVTARLVQLATDAAGTCTSNQVRLLAETTLQPGDHVDLAASVPLVVTPVGGAAYCLGFYSFITNGVTDATPYYPTFTFTAAVVAGRYAGTGLAPTPTTVGPTDKTR